MGATVSAYARAGGIVAADNCGCGPCCGTEAVVREQAKDEGVSADEIYRRTIKWSGKGRASVDNIPYVSVACGPMGCCAYYMPFVPQNVLPPSVWEPLKRECWTRGVGEKDLQNMFLQLCDPGDTSWGTVRVIPFLKTIDARARRTARRLVRAEAGLRARRMRFEDLTRCILDICMLDFAGLVIASARSLHRYQTLDVTTVRAIVRFAANDDVDLLTRAILRTAYPPDGTETHTSAAFVHFALRYPITVLPFLEMQTAFQRRFPSLQFWREHHQRRGTLLLPVVLTPDLARAITARTLILECLSNMATPFIFGSVATAVRERAGTLVSAAPTSVPMPWLEPPRYKLPNSDDEDDQEDDDDDDDDGRQEDDARGSSGRGGAAKDNDGTGASDDTGSLPTSYAPGTLPTTIRGRIVVSTTGAVPLDSTASATSPTTNNHTGRSSSAVFPTGRSAVGTGRGARPGTSGSGGSTTGRSGTMVVVTDGGDGLSGRASTSRSQHALFQRGTTRSEEARRWMTDRSIDVSLRRAPPPKTCGWVKKVPPPFGTIPQLTSVQIAERVYLHVASGAGASYDFVSAPCLLCGRNVAQVREDGRKERSQRRRSSGGGSVASMSGPGGGGGATLSRRSSSRRLLVAALRAASEHAAGSAQAGGKVDEDDDDEPVTAPVPVKKTKLVARWKVSAKEARKRQRLALRHIKSVQKAIRGMHALNTEDTLPDDGLALFEAPAGTYVAPRDGAVVGGTVHATDLPTSSAAWAGDVHEQGSSDEDDDDGEEQEEVTRVDGDAAMLQHGVVGEAIRSALSPKGSRNRMRTVSFRGEGEEKMDDDDDQRPAASTGEVAATTTTTMMVAAITTGAAAPSHEQAPGTPKATSADRRRPHTADSPSRSQRSLVSLDTTTTSDDEEAAAGTAAGRPRSADDVSGRNSRSSSHRNLPIWTPYNEEPNPNQFLRLASPAHPDRPPHSATQSGSLATASFPSLAGSDGPAAASAAAGAAGGGGAGGGAAAAGGGHGKPRKPTVVNEDGMGNAERFTKGNNGFCDECDVYIHKALVDSFGYKMAATIHRATALPPPVDREIAVRTALARMEKRPLRGLVPVPGGPIGARDRPQEFVFDDDVFLEMFDDATEDFFYYNVATGKSQWTRPAKYVPYTVANPN